MEECKDVVVHFDSIDLPCSCCCRAYRLKQKETQRCLGPTSDYLDIMPM